MKKILIAIIAICFIGTTVQAQGWRDKLKKATKNLVEGDSTAIYAKAKRDSIAAAAAIIEGTKPKSTTVATPKKPTKPKAPAAGTTVTGAKPSAPNTGATITSPTGTTPTKGKGPTTPPPPPPPSGSTNVTTPAPPAPSGSFEAVKGIPANAEKTINFSKTSKISAVSAAKTSLVYDGDAVYAMTNFKAPIQQAFQYLIPTLVVWLDGELIYISPRTDLMSSQETTIKFQVLPEGDSKDGEAVCFQILNNMLSKLTPGNHKLIVGWTASGGHTYDALGWYGEINLAAGDFKKWTATANNVHAGNVAKNELPKAFTSDPSLESKMVATTNNYAKSQGWKETFSKAVIISDWYTIRHKRTGIILGRSRSAVICATWPDGHCTFQDMGFKQDYDGSKYSSTLMWNGVGSQTEIECHKIK